MHDLLPRVDAVAFAHHHLLEQAAFQALDDLLLRLGNDLSVAARDFGDGRKRGPANRAADHQHENAERQPVRRQPDAMLRLHLERHPRLVLRQQHILPDERQRLRNRRRHALVHPVGHAEEAFDELVQ